MRQLTVRGIEPEIEQKIRRIAKKNGKSINQVIKEIIEEKFKDQGQKTPASSLRQLAGGWSCEEAADFERAIQSCEQIDAEMWR